MAYGIVGWGVYISENVVDNYRYVEERNKVKRPEDRIAPEKVTIGLGVKERRKFPPTENSATIGKVAAHNAIKRADIDPKDIAAVYFATESPVNAVAPPTELIKELGLSNNIKMIQTIFTCAGGMLAFDTACNEMYSPRYKGKYILVISSDTAQSYLGDELENTVADGASAFVIGENPVAEIEDITKDIKVYTSSTKDFWRENGNAAPSHNGKETVKAYKKHVVESLKELLKDNCSIDEFDKIGMHSPFPKIMKWAADKDKEPFMQDNPLEELVEDDLFSKKIDIAWKTGSVLGNPYSATIGIILANILENSNPGEKILISSYGSGAAAVSINMKIKEGIKEAAGKGDSVEDYLSKRKEISPETARQWLEQRINKH